MLSTPLIIYRGSSFRTGMVGDVRMERNASTGMAVLYFVVFVSFLDTHAQMPILASYSSELGATPFVIGLIVGIYSFTSIIGNGVSGVVIDRSGWRLPLVVGLLFASISLFGYALAPDTSTLLAVRAVHGIAGGLLIPATLMAISSICDPEELRGRMARYGVVIGTAAFLGPMFAGMFASAEGFRSTYLVLATLMMICFVIVLISLRLIPCDKGIKKVASTPLRFTPFLIISFLAAFATMGATGTLVSHVPVHGASIGLDSARIGMAFGSFALLAIITQMAWPRLIAKRVTPIYGCITGIIFMAMALATVPFTSSSITLVLCMALFGTGFGTVFPNMLMLVHSGEVGNRGRMMAVFFVFYSLGVAIVPPVAGYLYQYQGLIPTFTSMAFCIVIVPSIILISRRYQG